MLGGCLNLTTERGNHRERISSLWFPLSVVRFKHHAVKPLEKNRATKKNWWPKHVMLGGCLNFTTERENHRERISSLWFLISVVRFKHHVAKLF